MKNGFQRRTGWLLIVAGLVWLAPSLVAQGAAPTKVAVIALQEAIANTAEGKKAFADLQKKYQPRQQDLQRQQSEMQSLQDQLQKQSTTLSEEERLRLTRELEDKQKIFKRATEDASADYQTDVQDITRRIGQKMMAVVSDYAQQNGFALVIDGAQLPIYFIANDLDITAEVVKRYDATHPQAGSAPATGATTRPAAAKPAAATAKPAEKPKQP